MQYAETQNWDFTVVANIFEEHKQGFNTPFSSTTTQTLNAMAASSSKMSQTI
jgi:hypothetical protein